MSEAISRHIQIDNWIFEVKMVRALRVKNYGEPYSAIANISLNGNSAYLDGIMQKNQHPISDDDMKVFQKFCRKMNIDQLKVESRNGYRITEETQSLANTNSIKFLPTQRDLKGLEARH